MVYLRYTVVKAFEVWLQWDIIILCNSCNMAMRDLPDMYIRSPRAAGPRIEGIYIRRIMNGHVTTIMYHFVPIVTTLVVLILQVIVTLVCKVISTNC